MASRLDGNPGLRDELKGDPKRSPRWNEVLDLAGECELAVSFATEFAESVASASPARLPAERVSCIRQRASELNPGDIGALIDAGTKGGEPAAGSDAQAKVDAVLSGCGVDVPALRAHVTSKNGRGSR